MSWHFAFTSKTKQEAITNLAEAVVKNQPHCPEIIGPAGDRLISLMPEAPAKPIVVMSYGHIDQNGGNALIEVKIAP